MKILLFAAAIIVALFAYPLLNEGVGSSCHALELRALPLILESSQDDLPNNLTGADAAIASQLFGSMTNGAFARALVKEKYSYMPPTIGCTFMYWQTIFDPGVVENV